MLFLYKEIENSYSKSKCLYILFIIVLSFENPKSTAMLVLLIYFLIIYIFFALFYFK